MWELVSQGDGYTTLMDAHGCQYRLPTERLHLQFAPLPERAQTVDASREAFDKLMDSDGWKWVTPEQREVFWEIWEAAQLCR
ncbi:MAG: hypothetical protein ACRCYB_02490 [Aeromonas veronii]